MTQNPDKSPHVQALLDLITHNADYGGMTLQEALDYLQHDDIGVYVADQLADKWDARTYPDHRIKWRQLYADPRIHQISDLALQVLLLLAECMPESGWVQISRDDIAGAMGVQTKSKQLTNAMRELKAADLIRVAKPAIPRKHIPATYAINPDVLYCGPARRRAGAKGKYGRLPGPDPAATWQPKRTGVDQLHRDLIRPDQGTPYARITTTEAKKIPADAGDASAGDHNTNS